MDIGSPGPYTFVATTLLAASTFHPVSRQHAYGSQYLCIYVLYNLWLHPLARFDGPTLWAAFRFPSVHAILSGQHPHKIKALHDLYGDVVRIAPNELSFLDPASWKDIYSHKEFIRPAQFRNRLPGKVADNLVTANIVDHARFRTIFSPAFSDQALKQHERIVDSYVNKLIESLRQRTSSSKRKQETTVNLVEWFHFVAFDIIGDLGWGKSFQCLDNDEYHPWIRIATYYKAAMLNSCSKYYPPLNTFLQLLRPASAKAAIRLVTSTAEESVQERLSRKVDRPDIISHVLNETKTTDSPKLSIEELECNAMALIVAGSDTLATVLGGIINYLLIYPMILKRLAQEIRSSFTSEAEIDPACTKQLPYLSAVIKEGLRMCHPFPDCLRRVVPKGGAKIAGYILPEGTVVGVSCWVMFQADRNFVHPGEFAPERWLPLSENSAYSGDNKVAFQPFSTGPANCLGQRLAWMELRIILAKVLYNFDINVPVGGKTLHWSSQKIWWTWQKEPVNVTLRNAGALH